MTTLPALPKTGAPISADQIARIEAHVAREISAIDDVETLQEWHAQAAALEAYLRGKELNGPMLGAQRRVEARIGQLLGEGQVGNPSITQARVIETIPRQDRNRFRTLARGLERGLAEEEWRQPRDPLIRLIQEKYPMPRHVPTVVTTKGAVRKPVAQRAKEIATLAGSGHRAAQIAKKAGISEQQVRKIAQEKAIKLPDETIGRTRRIDAKRVLTETINGVDAYVSGLTMLEEVELPALSATEQRELTEALLRSINGLRKLRVRMEKTYARSQSSAA